MSEYFAKAKGWKSFGQTVQYILQVSGIWCVAGLASWGVGWVLETTVQTEGLPETVQAFVKVVFRSGPIGIAIGYSIVTVVETCKLVAKSFRGGGHEV